MARTAFYDEASFDAFRMEMIEAGFEPVLGSDGRKWTGPLPTPLRSLTSAECMLIAFRDGWPYRPPEVYIPGGGITSEHFQRGSDILCLWQDADTSGGWLTLAGLQRRIEEWVDGHDRGFDPEDAMLDAHRYYLGNLTGLATLDLGELKEGDLGNDSTWKVYGSWNDDKTVLTLSRTRADIEGRGYYHEMPLPAPPHDLEAFKEALTTGQRKNFERRLDNVRRDGKPQIAVLLWKTAYGMNALVLYLTRGDAGQVQASPIEFAPTDEATLRLRCGPDAELLGDQRVVIFGAGAIGSQVAVLLASAGLRKITLVDGDIIRPGNVVRHQAVLSVGNNKVDATGLIIYMHAPWTEVKRVKESPWHPGRLRDLMTGASVIIDATGSGRFTALVGHVASDRPASLISAALYRGGAVARVRRQVPDRDLPIHERLDPVAYPIIPPDPDPSTPRLEAGCADPVNNASPVAVSQIASLTAEIALDTLTGRFVYTEEIVDVYRPLGDPGFDRPGRIVGA